MKRYYGANDYFRARFGTKVYKLALEGGYTCPHRDENNGGGCVFCAGGSGDFAESGDINEALARAKARVKTKNPQAYIAYFQSYTATYKMSERLKNRMTDAAKRDEIVALSVATRPDCLGGDVMDFIKSLREIKPVFVELGLQTANEETAKRINRGYENDVYAQAVRSLNDIGVNVITHIIIGLPGESKEDALSSALFAVKCGSDGLKLQLLHVLRGTALEKDYAGGKFTVMEIDEYVEALAYIIERIPENIVIHRLTGDGNKKILVAPAWSADKKGVINAINAYFEKNNVMQGSKTIYKNL